MAIRTTHALLTAVPLLPLMAFAAKTAPIVRAHLEAARKLPQ